MSLVRSWPIYRFKVKFKNYDMSQNKIYLVCKGGGVEIKGVSPLLKCPSGNVERCGYCFLKDQD